MDRDEHILRVLTTHVCAAQDSFLDLAQAKMKLRHRSQPHRMHSPHFAGCNFKLAVTPSIVARRTTSRWSYPSTLRAWVTVSSALTDRPVRNVQNCMTRYSECLRWARSSRCALAPSLTGHQCTQAYCEVPQATDSDSEDFPQPTMSSVRLLKLCQDCGVVQPMGLRAAQAAPGSPRLTSSAVLRIHSRVGDGTNNDDGDAPYTIDFAQFQRALYLIASALLSPSAGVDSGSSPGPREYATDDDVVALYERVAGLSPAWKVATGRTRSVNE